MFLQWCRQIGYQKEKIRSFLMVPVAGKSQITSLAAWLQFSLSRTVKGLRFHLICKLFSWMLTEDMRQLSKKWNTLLLTAKAVARVSDVLHGSPNSGSHWEMWMGLDIEGPAYPVGYIMGEQYRAWGTCVLEQEASKFALCWGDTTSSLKVAHCKTTLRIGPVVWVFRSARV